MTKVIIVDDHPVISKGIIKILESTKLFQVVLYVDSGNELLEKITEIKCDMIISDITMPGINGFQLLKKIKHTYPQIKFVILTMHKDKNFIQDAIKLNVDGYMLKEDPPEVMLNVLDGVMKGYTVFSPKIQTIMARNFSDDVSPLEQLTVRERQVFDLVVEGMSHKEIADDLAISISTVEFHKKNIKSKLHARNITDLLNIAFRYKETL